VLRTGTANITAAFSDAHGNLASSSAALNVSAATLSGITVAPGDAGVNVWRRASIHCNWHIQRRHRAGSHADSRLECHELCYRHG